MKYCLYLLIIYQIFLVNSTIPNWNLDNLSVNLFSSSSSDNKYEYNLYEADGYVLKKIITKDGDKIKYQNKLFYKVDNDNTIERNVDFERIESKYWNQLGSYRLICPKGSFHPYDFDNNEYIKPFDYDGNWELSCYKHNTGYFIMFYAHNGGNSIYYVKGNNRSIKQVSGTNELYSYKLPEYQDKGKNYEYRMPSIQKKNGYLKIMGYCLIMNSDESNANANTIQGENGLIEAKSDSRGTISDDNYLYYFTYNDISDFTSGYSTNDYIKDYSDKNYHYASSVTINNNNGSPLSFVDNVEIKEIKFIPGTQYVYYKLYNSDKDTTYCGLIDVKTNKVVYNIEADIISFTPDYNNHMLAMTSTTLYRICIYKNGDSCSDTACSTLMLDPDGNKCQSSCDSGKIKLIPENICINLNLCDLNIYILNAAGTECGLCKNINPDGPIYKLINTTGCLSEIPNNAEYYNEAQKLLKCKTNYHLEGNQCLPDSCYERCETCSEISTNDDDQKCLTCKEGYIFDDETKNCNTPAPTTQIITPTTQEVIPTTQEVIPTTQEVIPTTQELVPTTQIAPTTQIITPTTQEIIPSTQEIIPTTQIVTEAPTTTPETENILE